MPEIKPDLTDTHRCISVHWTLPVQCVLPRAHRDNWHETWHPQTRNRIRYRRTVGVTEELRAGEWRDLGIPAPGEICGEPHSPKPGVFCQQPRNHNEISWTHSAVFEGCRYTWNTLRPKTTQDQDRQDVVRLRELADEQGAEINRLRAENEQYAETTRRLHTAWESARDRARRAEAERHQYYTALQGAARRAAATP